MRNEARRSADLLWALGDREALRRATAVEGRAHIEAALAPGRGAILAGLHLGGWEIAASIAEDAIPGPTTAVVADDWLAWAMHGRRHAVGLRTVPRTDAADAAGEARLPMEERRARIHARAQEAIDAMQGEGGA